MVQGVVSLRSHAHSIPSLCLRYQQWLMCLTLGLGGKQDWLWGLRKVLGVVFSCPFPVSQHPWSPAEESTNSYGQEPL